MRKILLIFTTCFALLGSAYAQQEVTGTVVDIDGAGIPGVSIIQVGTTNGTITNLDGVYTITVPSDAVLSFSFIGMTTVAEPLNGRTTIDVQMTMSTIGLDEVVVTALGIQREAKTLTYANQTVNSEELTNTQDLNFMNALSGKAAVLMLTFAVPSTPFLVVIRTTPLAPWLPYREAALEPFSKLILSISSGFSWERPSPPSFPPHMPA